MCCTGDEHRLGAACRHRSAGRSGYVAQASQPAPATTCGRAAFGRPAASHAATTAADQNAVVKQYCVGCHNDKRKDSSGGLALETFDVAKVADNAAVGEHMIRKLQAGMMPPPGAQRPDAAGYVALINALETRIDSARRRASPNPGRRTFPRLNRAEYARAVKDLLGIEVDAGKWLPLDTMSANFDNIADEQALSPTLLESYLNAAGDISRMAVGDHDARATSITPTRRRATCRSIRGITSTARRTARAAAWSSTMCSPPTASTSFEVTLNGGDNARFEDIDISIDGERVALAAVRDRSGRRRRRPRRRRR